MCGVCCWCLMPRQREVVYHSCIWVMCQHGSRGHTWMLSLDSCGSWGVIVYSHLEVMAVLRQATLLVSNPAGVLTCVDGAPTQASVLLVAATFVQACRPSTPAQNGRWSDVCGGVFVLWQLLCCAGLGLCVLSLAAMASTVQQTRWPVVRL
jgi:hypothetical protein